MGPPDEPVTLRRDFNLLEQAEAIAARLASRRLIGEYADSDSAEVVARQAAEEIVAQGWRYEIDVDAVVPHGHVVLVLRAEDRAGASESHVAHDMVVVDLQLDDLSLAPAVCRLVEEVALEAGAARLAVPFPPGDLVRATFLVGGGFRPISCRCVSTSTTTFPRRTGCSCRRSLQDTLSTAR